MKFLQFMRGILREVGHFFQKPRRIFPIIRGHILVSFKSDLCENLKKF